MQEGSCFINVICVCLLKVVSNTYCVVFLLGFSLSCVPYVASFSGLSILLAPSYCQFLWIVHFVCPFVLPVSLDCPFCLPLRVTSFSGLSILFAPSVFSGLSILFSPSIFSGLLILFAPSCCQFLWIVHFACPFGIL